MEAINRSPILGVSEMGRRVAQKPTLFYGEHEDNPLLGGYPFSDTNSGCMIYRMVPPSDVNVGL